MSRARRSTLAIIMAGATADTTAAVTPVTEAVAMAVVATGAEEIEAVGVEAMVEGLGWLTSLRYLPRRDDPEMLKR